MALWLKQEDGTLVEVSGGGGGSFDGEHVLTGDPDSPPEGWAAGQLLYDGLQDAAGDAGGALTWPLLAPEGTRFAPSYSFSTNGASGTYLAADGSVRIAAEGTDTIGFDSRYITLGGQQQGVGRMSILSGSSGSPVYGFEGDIGTGIYRAGSGVLGVSTGGVERLRVGASSTFTGDLSVGSAENAKAIRTKYLRAYGSGDYGWPSYSWVEAPNTGFYLHDASSKTVGMYGNLQVDGALYLSGNWSGGWVYNTSTSNREFMIIGDASSGGQIQIYGNNDSNRPGKVSITGDLLVNGIGVSRFNVAPDIDTADVLDRAETATMPAPDAEGVATADVEGLTVNEVVTALLLKVKELSAEIKELKGN